MSPGIICHGAPSAANAAEVAGRCSRSITTDELVRTYLVAKRCVVEAGYAREIAWQAEASLSSISPESFVREAAWVVLSAGMRETVIRRVFDDISSALHGFDAEWILKNESDAFRNAYAVFSHRGKILAILAIVRMVDGLGSDGLLRAMSNPQAFLQGLPYVGPVTWRHLAKNLGCATAKADRHLVRLARKVGRSSVVEMCEEISMWIGDPIAVVDLVLWRWSVLESTNHLSRLRSTSGTVRLSGARSPSVLAVYGDSDEEYAPRGLVLLD